MVMHPLRPLSAIRHYFGGVRSTSVRFAIAYAVLFSFSAGLFLSVIWWGTVGLLERQVETAVAADARALSERWTDGGLSALALTIEDRLEDNVDDDEIYLIIDPKGHRVAGNLPSWPSEIVLSGSWYQLSIRRAGNKGVAEVQAFDLPGGYRLLVGRDMRARAILRQLLTDTLLWACAMVTALAIGGGLLVRSLFRRMIQSIARTTTAIAHGDMSRRMPRLGRGDELDEVADAVNEMLDRITRLMDGVRQVSNAIAHDLRTPITRARTQLEDAALNAPDDPALRAAIEQGVADLDNITAVFEALLRIAQIEAGSRRSAFARFDLIAALRDMAELYEAVAEEKGIHIMLRMPETLTFYGDRSMIQQAVANLVDNAIKFSPEGSEVTLAVATGPGLGQMSNAGPASPADGALPGTQATGAAAPSETVARLSANMVTVAVCDQGIGMMQEDMQRASERFFRADSARNTPGSGLGLSLVQAIVQLHGGSLHLDSCDPGLMVRMTMPLPAGERRPYTGEMKEGSSLSHARDRLGQVMSQS